MLAATDPANPWGSVLRWPEAEEAMTPTGPPVSRPGDVWRLGRRRLLQGDARDAVSYAQLLRGEVARLVFTDVPYNVRIAGHVSSNANHREFAMATGEMSPADYAAAHFAEIAVVHV